ncbi:MAG: SusC/RagA family TonB-linked outer membrane protein, partial [Phaeodactylibacter sp.]|nr:SusC/RagA family TonB-linked outer membrane protein [Phaeodactylibacter sp.]
MKHFLFLLLMLLSAQTFAQRTLTGQVSDTEGEPLIGVNILVKDTDAGTITDFDGNFSLRIPEGGEILVFSYIGYATKEVVIGTQTRIDIEMSTDAEALEEVIVVGYGTKKKRDVIGSVATVKSENITKLKSTSFVDGLQGQASGVQVVANSGVPGAPSTVKIRGISSISINTDPLWIVDGMPIYSGGNLGGTNGATAQDPMSLINPNDIESIQVLKDAAATAIYGSRGSNGVIIITTKSGKEGKGSITLDYSTGITEPSRNEQDIGFANTEEWFNLVETARLNSFGGEEEALFDPNSILNLFQDDPIARLSREEALAINTNWFDQILDRGNFQDINVSGTKGFQGGNMFVSFGYRNDNSVLRNNGLERYSVRANLQFNPLQNLRVETRMNFSFTNNDRVKQQAGGALGNNSGGNSAGWGNANRNALPWYPIFNSDHPSGYWNPMSGNNLIAAIDRDYLVDEVTSYRGLGGLAVEYSIPFVEGLAIRAEGAFDLVQSNTLNWIRATLREFGSYASDQSITRQSINYNVYAKYNRDFGNHGLSFTVGTESQSIRSESRFMEGQNLTGTYQEIGSPQDLLTISGGLSGEEYLRAYFGRADYKFNNRYFLGLSFRQDGSSKFNEEYRMGTFPALSAGWVISDEPFWSSRTFSSVKLRGSYGQTGNKNIPSNRFVTTYANRTSWRYGPADAILQGTRITNIGVPSLTWETTSSYDAGVDFGLWEGRLSGSFAYYFQDVSDLLLASPLATSAGLNSNRIWGNIGDMSNWGVELELSSTNIRRDEFTWTTDFNIT